MRIMLVLAKDNIYRFDSLHQRKYYPQITLITLESLIDKKYNAEIVLVDEGVEEYDATSSKYSDKKFDLICISAVISASRRAKEISKFWKDRGAYTQIGGHYATVLSDEALEYFDTVIVMDEDKNVRDNRIGQLTYIMNLFGKIASLNKLD